MSEPKVGGGRTRRLGHTGNPRYEDMFIFSRNGLLTETMGMVLARAVKWDFR